MSDRPLDSSRSDDDPLWYKDAIIYQLHVRAFLDSNADGIGDLRGLTEKLDYVQDLGVTALWLLPFYPSPLKDDGYDIADYLGVHPAYGTLQDLKELLREAHRRGLRVITELVLNHTSDQHHWFARARRARPGSRARDFYVWGDTPERYRDARIIFKDFETSNWAWDPIAKAYYWHRFYSHQPDLNYDNPEVRETMLELVEHWLAMGVDGLRLDAVPYLFEREGTTCENLPETHEFLKQLRRHVDERFAGRFLLAEANQWPDDAAAYFGQGDECQMAFHFPVMPRLFMAIRMENRFPIIDILRQTPAIPANCQWALFLRNHDELTLEMVTDEERDYMYRMYANDRAARINLGIRRRLAPLLDQNRRKIELMHGLLLSLPGTPVLYYGDEIGMGDNFYLGDRNGVRTPMQWSADRNAGFSRANPQRLYLPVIIDPQYHYEAINVESQQASPSSLLWWIKRLIAQRKRFRALSRGSIEFLYPDNSKVLAFLRQHEGETLLVVANLSRFVQPLELNLAAFQGQVPVEVFGRTEFPVIDQAPYRLTLGPHGFSWFVLERRQAPLEPQPAALATPTIALKRSWRALFEDSARARLEAMLPALLSPRRWFGGKARSIRATTIVDVVPVTATVSIVLVQVEYLDGDPQIYVIPMAFAAGEEGERLVRESVHAVLLRIDAADGQGGVVFDPVSAGRELPQALLSLIEARGRLRGSRGRLIAMQTRPFRELRGSDPRPLEAAVLKVEQSNSTLVYESRLILKLFRSVEPGINPDFEIGARLTEQKFPHSPPLAGTLEYQRPGAESITVAVLHGFVPNEGDAWSYTLSAVGRYFERCLALPPGTVAPTVASTAIGELAAAGLPPELRELMGTYAESARLMGRRTAELHVALAAPDELPDFAPEPFTPHFQRSTYQSIRSFIGPVLDLLRRRAKTLPDEVRAKAEQVLAQEAAILKRVRAVIERKLGGMRTRCHGDFHLGQVLHTGKDFVIFDFEGEPSRRLSERRLKRSPLRDVAGMFRSFHYAAATSLHDAQSPVRSEDRAALEPFAHVWHVGAAALFLSGYLEVAGIRALLPGTMDDIQMLLGVYTLEKAIYEAQYELNSRPDWLGIPLDGVLDLIGSPGPSPAGVASKAD